ncbi:MAG: ankyrin repeat domain-containing protein, partial [Bacteroidetes bacterium]
LLIQKKPKVLTNNGTILHSAVSSGSVDLVKKCIEAKLDVNAKDDDELTPLFIAAMADSKEIVGMLLAAGARVDAEDQSGKTALHYAAINGNKEMISMLLAAGAEVNAKTERDITPLHYAALCASPEIVNLLLEHKAEVNTKTTYKTSLFSLVMKTLAQGLGTRFGIFKLFQSNMAVVDAQVDRAQEVDLTPLHFAASNGSPGVVQLLVERNAAIEAPSSMKSTPLHVALRANRDTIALYLLSRKANVNAQDDNKNTPLHIAARNQDILMIQALLENGADISLIDKEDSTVFDILFARENYGGIKLLCENLKANTSLMKRFIETETPVLQYAALAGDVALVKMLVDSKAKINDRHYMTSLQFAMVGGSASIVDLLLASGADPGEKTSNGNTSVHIAAATGNSSFIQLMLSKISDGINKTNDNGQTPLMLAICSRNVDAVKQLVASGADVKAKDKQRMNALHYAAAVGSLDMVKYFVEEQKLDVKSEASEAVTPLHVAASMDKPEIVEYLLLNGAKLDAKTSEGFTALHYAAQNGNFDLVKSFEAKGAKHLDAQFIVWRKTLYGAAQYAKEWGSLGLVGMLVYSARDNRSHNWKPIHLAARNGHNDIVQFLRQTGEMVTAKTDDKLTPLHLASMNGNIEAMKTILSDFSSGLGPGEQLSVSELDTFYSYYGKKAKFIVTSGCNVNSQDANGWTPLHWAYLFEREEAVDLLKKMGADIDRLTTSEVKITENIFIKQDLPPQYLHGVLGYILEIVRNPHINTVGPTRMELWR